MSGDILTNIIAILILLMLSAYFSASETAFSSANKKRLKALAEKGSRTAERAVRIAERGELMLSAVLIGNNIVNIVLAALTTVLFIRICGNEDMATTLAAISATLLVLIFGEITPKCVALGTPERVAILSAPLLQILMFLTAPLCRLFTWWQGAVGRLFKFEQQEKMSSEELLMVVDEFQQEGSINNNEVALLRNAIEFPELDAKDILTPRVKVAAVAIDSSKEEIAAMFSKTKFSRLIVYKENIDNIIGVIHQKNFYNGVGIADKSIAQMISPTIFVSTIFVSTTEKISTILKKLQQKQAQVAVVLDEFGGTYGIITMEDVLEELVGEIWDELDQVTTPFQKISDTVERVDGAVELADFCNHFNVEIESEMVSLSGWVMEYLHSLPKPGDNFTYEHLQISVLKVEQRCITSLEVRILPEASAEVTAEPTAD